MRTGRHPGIRLKMTLAFGAVFTLLSLCLNVYSYHKIRQLIIRDNNLYLLARAQSLLDKTEVRPVIIPLPDKYVSLRVYARSASGLRTQLFQSPGDIGRVALPAASGVTDTLGLRVAYVANSSDENPAELMMAVSGEQLGTTLQYLWFLLLLSTLVSVLVSGIVSYWLARFFLLPVQKIIRAANNINTHQLRERVPVTQSNDELQDLAETLNQMLERIDRSLQQQQSFFASASHELKTPLAIMRAELETSLTKTPDKQLAHFLSSQLAEITRLQNVVQEFLVISQIKEDKLRIQYETFDLSMLSLRVFEQLRQLADLRQVRTALHFDEEADGFFIHADHDKLKIVLINLLENAIKYSRPHTAITCRVGTLSQQSQLEIVMENFTEQAQTDTAMLTQAFFRGEVWQQGSGIGLWLCRQIVDAHGGRMAFRSADHRFSVRVVLPLRAMIEG